MRSADKTRLKDHMEAGRMAQQIKALAVQPRFGARNPHKGGRTESGPQKLSSALRVCTVTHTHSYSHIVHTHMHTHYNNNIFS